MLDSRKSKGFNENKVVSIVGPGTTVNGEIHSQGTIRVEGTVIGSVISDDSIVIQESGKVKADLNAGQIIISGEVQGNVYAQDRLEITSTGKIIGDIAAPRISIAEGVLFEGKCTTAKPPEMGKGRAPALPQPQKSAPEKSAQPQEG